MFGEYTIPVNPRNPSAPDIIDALARAYDGGSDASQAVFYLPNGEPFVVQVTSVAYEIPEPGLFRIGGKVKTGGDAVGKQFTGYYNTRMRCGNFTVVD